MGGDEIFTAESGEPSEEFNDSGYFQSGNGGSEIFFGDGSGTITVGSGNGENATGSSAYEFSSVSGTEKEETPFLVEDGSSLSGQALEDAIVNALHTVFSEEDVSVTAEESEEPTPTPVLTATATPSPMPVYDHDIDDIYDTLERIENLQSLTYSDSLSYHQGQDIIGRVEIGIFSILLGGLIAFGFIGRIR